MADKHAGVSALLDLAADLMDEHGWQVGDYFEVAGIDLIDEAGEYHGGMMCTEGALRAANAVLYGRPRRANRELFNPETHAEIDAARDAVREMVPLAEKYRRGHSIIFSLPWWNDNQCCSKSEAVGVLRDAATKTRPDA